MLYKNAVLRLSRSSFLQRNIQAYGWAAAKRFIAGRTQEEAFEAGTRLNEEGKTIIFDIVGENATTAEEARAHTTTYLQLLQAVHARHLDAIISTKPTHMGMDVSEACCLENYNRIMDEVIRSQSFLWVDMESSEYTTRTISLVEHLWHEHLRSLGLCLQANLKRSSQDVHRLMRIDLPLRVVKGAYQESRDIAFAKKNETDAHYQEMVRTIFHHGHYSAIATHDERLVNLTSDLSQAECLTPPSV